MFRKFNKNLTLFTTFLLDISEFYPKAYISILYAAKHMNLFQNICIKGGYTKIANVWSSIMKRLFIRMNTFLIHAILTMGIRFMKKRNATVGMEIQNA